MRNRREFFVFSVILGVFFLAACQQKPTPTLTSTGDPTLAVIVSPEFFPETPVQTIPLTGELEACNAEISGMAWYGDYLILLPQYPNFFLGLGERGDGALFAIPKADLDAYLSGASSAALQAIQIPLDADGANEITGFEGFEALVFNGDDVYLTIEVRRMGKMSAQVVKGRIAPDLSKVSLDAAIMPEIETQSGISNVSDEALLLVGDELLTIHEANGERVNPAPVAHRLDMDLSVVGTLPLPNIEYRLTDATELDADGRFWAINYFYPGDAAMLPESDPIVEKFGQGETHAASDGVERLLEFSYNAAGIALIDTPPILLKLLDNGDLRNWEGIVRYADGFLLATDKYPCTILGYVPRTP